MNKCIKNEKPSLKSFANGVSWWDSRFYSVFLSNLPEISSISERKCIFSWQEGLWLVFNFFGIYEIFLDSKSISDSKYIIKKKLSIYLLKKWFFMRKTKKICLNIYFKLKTYHHTQIVKKNKFSAPWRNSRNLSKKTWNISTNSPNYYEN